MRVLVTGADGFVGHHLVKELVDHGHGVVALSREGGVSPHLAKYADDYVAADMTQEMPTLPRFDAAIHLAGLAAVGPSFDMPAEYIAANTAMVANLMEPLIGSKPSPSVLVVSSGAVYDPNQPMPVHEHSRTSPTSPYVVSKMAVEQLSIYYALRGINVTIARPFNHIGPGQGLGFLVPDLIRGVREQQASGLPMTVGNLTTARDYTDVRDVVSAYRSMIESNLNPGAIFNVSSGIARSGNDLLAAIAKELGAEGVRPVVDPTRFRPSDPPRICGDSSALRKETSWYPAIPLEATIRDLITANGNVTDEPEHEIT